MMSNYFNGKCLICLRCFLMKMVQMAHLKTRFGLTMWTSTCGCSLSSFTDGNIKFGKLSFTFAHWSNWSQIWWVKRPCAAQNWLTFCHPPLNSHRFLASGYLIGPRLFKPSSTPPSTPLQLLFSIIHTTVILMVWQPLVRMWVDTACISSEYL